MALFRKKLNFKNKRHTEWRSSVRAIQFSSKIHTNIQLNHPLKVTVE